MRLGGSSRIVSGVPSARERPAHGPDAEPGVLHVAGAGPAGLAAAIAAARAGARVVVHEIRRGVGARFRGDFQGIENWTDAGDVLAELRAFGIETDFEQVAVREVTCFDPTGHEFTVGSAEPLLHLVRRGPGEGTLDRALLAQAERAGAEVRFGSDAGAMESGGVVAEGPRRADGIAVGYTFATDLPDCACVVLDDRLAPAGYAYLLVHAGAGTVATCLFRDFREQRRRLDATVAFFAARKGLRMDGPRRFGGFGNFDVPGTARRGRTLLAGEAAGFQDALWGFGIRNALVSGGLAGEAAARGAFAEYDALWRARLGRHLRAAMVNRWLFSRIGNRGYVRLFRGLERSGDIRAWMRRVYRSTWWKETLFPLARASHRRARRGRSGDALHF